MGYQKTEASKLHATNNRDTSSFWMGHMMQMRTSADVRNCNETKHAAMRKMRGKICYGSHSLTHSSVGLSITYIRVLL